MIIDKVPFTNPVLLSFLILHLIYYQYYVDSYFKPYTIPDLTNVIVPFTISVIKNYLNLLN